MTERLCIAVPVNVWTPGLHQIRSQFLDESMRRIPPHVLVWEGKFPKRGVGCSLATRLEELQRLGEEVPAFSYSLSELFWDEVKRALYLLPTGDGGRFNWLKRTAQGLLGFTSDFRESSSPRLALAVQSGLGKYQLEEKFRELNGENFLLSCRATEVEIYRKLGSEWYLNSTIPLRQSDEN